MDATQDIMARLDDWRRERRQFYGIAGGLMSLGFLGAVLVLGALRPGRPIETRSLTLRDGQGQVRAELSLDGSGLPHLSMYNENGREQCRLETLRDNATSLRMMDGGQIRACLSTHPDGSAILNFFDKNSQSGTGLYMWPDSTTGIQFQNGQSQVSLTLKPDGVGGLAVLDAEGRSLVAAPQAVKLTAVGAEPGRFRPKDVKGGALDLPERIGPGSLVPQPASLRLQRSTAASSS